MEIIEGVLKTLATFVAYFAEILAAVIIVIGMIQAAWKSISYLIKRKENMNELTESRLKFGHSLSLGLAFLVGADIVKSAISPDWHSLIHLGAVVLIRIVMNYFLMKDIEHLLSEQSRKEIGGT
jgi:uncharacterized membrane protein